MGIIDLLTNYNGQTDVQQPKLSAMSYEDFQKACELIYRKSTTSEIKEMMFAKKKPRKPRKPRPY